jgi:serine/threonine protein kinase
MAETVGQTLGQYQIIERIGAGGMAVIYKAYQPSLDRFVALKVLPAYHALTPGFSERFNREARAVARLSHPNIMPIYDFGQEGGLSYIVMKYVPGGTLKERMGKPMNLKEVAQTVSQIAAALDHAHRRGVVHRDVKPTNVLFDEGDWVLLTDFGLAKMVAGEVQLTASGAAVGTPAYMSPEQGQGVEVDARTDIYSLGIILYEMATGDAPFKGDTPVMVMLKHITEPLPPPRSLNPDLPEAVERVIVRATAKKPADRYQTVGELLRELLQSLELAPHDVEPTVPWDIAPTPSVVLETPTAPARRPDAFKPPVSGLRACLTITSGRERGREFEIKDQVCVGRRRDNDIVLSDPEVSGHHARITITEGGFVLTDLGSSNGTWVNGKRIAEPQLLHDGDIIRMGETEWLFEREHDTIREESKGLTGEAARVLKRCPNCDTRLTPADLFCPTCGRPASRPERLY